MEIIETPARTSKKVALWHYQGTTTGTSGIKNQRKTAKNRQGYLVGSTYISDVVFVNKSHIQLSWSELASSYEAVGQRIESAN